MKPVRGEAPASRAIEVCSAANVRTFWLRVRDVSRRTEGRSKKQYERYYLVFLRVELYLLLLANHRLLRYPLKVLKGESPDFMLVENPEKRRESRSLEQLVRTSKQR